MICLYLYIYIHRHMDTYAYRYIDVVTCRDFKIFAENRIEFAREFNSRANSGPKRCCFFVSGTSNIGLQTRDHYEHVIIFIIFIAPFWKKAVLIHIIFLYILIPWSFNITLIYRLYRTWPICSWWCPKKMGDFPPAEPPGLGRILHLCKPLLRKPGRPWASLVAAQAKRSNQPQFA
jgi:hypothetical protein